MAVAARAPPRVSRRAFGDRPPSDRPPSDRPPSDRPPLDRAPTRPGPLDRGSFLRFGFTPGKMPAILQRALSGQVPPGCRSHEPLPSPIPAVPARCRADRPAAGSARSDVCRRSGGPAWRTQAAEAGPAGGVGPGLQRGGHRRGVRPDKPPHAVCGGGFVWRSAAVLPRRSQRSDPADRASRVLPLAGLLARWAVAGGWGLPAGGDLEQPDLKARAGAQGASRLYHRDRLHRRARAVCHRER